MQNETKTDPFRKRKKERKKETNWVGNTNAATEGLQPEPALNVIVP